MAKKLDSKKSLMKFVKLGSKKVMTNPDEGENWKNALILGSYI
jgi:hypothetical protein